MLTVYGWKLNEDLIFGGDARLILESMKRYEFPRAFLQHRTAVRINKHSPYSLLRKLAIREARDAVDAQQSRRWNEAISHFQKCAWSVERFRHPSVLDLTQRCYLASAECAIAADRAARGLFHLRQFSAIADISEAATKLRRIARDIDANEMENLKRLRTASGLALAEVESALDYVADYPLVGRLRIARDIIEKYHCESGISSNSLVLLARCCMLEGKSDDAVSILTLIAHENQRCKELLERWRNILSPTEDSSKLILGIDPDDLEMDVGDCVNLGLTCLVNALYGDASYWLGRALEMNPRDPFGIFGHALLLWRLEWYALAAERFRLAEGGIRSYPREFRIVLFARYDEICAARCYYYNPMYPIYNPGDCLDKVTKLQPFVSASVSP